MNVNHLTRGRIYDCNFRLMLISLKTNFISCNRGRVHIWIKEHSDVSTVLFEQKLIGGYVAVLLNPLYQVTGIKLFFDVVGR